MPAIRQTELAASEKATHAPELTRTTIGGVAALNGPSSPETLAGRRWPHAGVRRPGIGAAMKTSDSTAGSKNGGLEWPGRPSRRHHKGSSSHLFPPLCNTIPNTTRTACRIQDTDSPAWLRSLSPFELHTPNMPCTPVRLPLLSNSVGNRVIV